MGAAPFSPLTPAPSGIWGGDPARLTGERGGGGARKPPAASRRRCPRALPPPPRTPPARGRPAGDSTSSWALRAAGPALRQPQPRAGLPRPPRPTARPAPRWGAAWRCRAGRRAGEGRRPARPPRLSGDSAAAGARPVASVSSKIKACAATQRQESASCRSDLALFPLLALLSSLRPGL